MRARNKIPPSSHSARPRAPHLQPAALVRGGRSSAMRRPWRRVYKTAEWQRVRELVIQRANGLCEECLRQGRIEAGEEVDHIVPLDETNWRDWGVAYNPDNLQLLCRDCHNVKHGRVSSLQQFVEPVP